MRQKKSIETTASCNTRRFRQITHDIADARVYGGIHYRFDQKAAARLGHAVGAEVYKNNLRRTNEDD